MKLCAYLIDGEPVGSVVDSWDESSLNGNAAFQVVDSIIPVGYGDISSIENWHNLGSTVLGSVFGFKDWMSLRANINPLVTAITGVDYSNFDDLSDAQKIIALKYFPTRIIGYQGFPFFVTKSGGLKNAYSYIDFYTKNAEEARGLRYTNYVNFGYQYLGALQGLKAESILRSYFLDVTYIKRGVLWFEDDGIDGFGNWTISNSNFTVTGLKAIIVSGEFILSGITVDPFIASLVEIIENGSY